MANIRSIRTRLVRDVSRTLNGNKIIQVTDWCKTLIVNEDGSVVGSFLEQCVPTISTGSLGPWDVGIQGFEYTNFVGYCSGYRNYDA